MRAGAVMLVGVAAVNGGNYLFHLIAARDLGPRNYGDLVALLTLAALVSLPLAALQVVVSRYVARFTAVGDAPHANRLNRRIVSGTVVFSLVALALICALTPLIQQWLSIASASAVIVTSLLILPSALTPVVWGIAQGLQRFTLLALSMTVGTVARIAALVAFIVAGLSTWSAVTATLVGMTVSMVVPFVPLRGWFRRPASTTRSGEDGVESLLRATAPAALALLAFTSLTQADVLAANAAFGDTTSGIYSAASLIGRVILYLPAAVVAVLLPKVAARAASNRSTVDILGSSLLATFAFCALSTLVYAVIPRTIVNIAFGAKYEAAQKSAPALRNRDDRPRDHQRPPLLPPRPRRERVHVDPRSRLSLAILAFVLFHSAPRSLVLDTIVVSTLVIVAHELVTNWTMTRAARDARRSLRGSAMSLETAKRFSLALVISATVTVLWAIPVVTHMNSRLLGGPSDSTSTIRDYWYDAHIGKSPFSAKHDSFVAAPEGVDLSPGIQAANAVQPLVVWRLEGRSGSSRRGTSSFLSGLRSAPPVPGFCLTGSARAGSERSSALTPSDSAVT